jgi:ribonuclease P protein component
MTEQRRYNFSHSKRLRTRADFSAVHGAKVRQSRGPLTIYAKPNDLAHPRVGLSVSRSVGTAPRRNKIKRLIREAFRLMQHDLPRGYDMLIVVRPHEPMILAEYQRILSAVMVKLHAEWQQRDPS